MAFGPTSGSIGHDPDDGFIGTYWAGGVETANAVIEARFHNPYSSAEGNWSSGFIFRDRPNWFHVVVITDEGRWVHTLRLGVGNEDTIGSGHSRHIDTGANGSNRIRVVAIGGKGALFVNGHHVADLNLSGLTEAGGVNAVGEYFGGDGVKGKSTRFEDFTIRTFLRDDPPPTATPTATPTARPTPIPVDRAVLIALYRATGGGYWANRTNWLSDRPISEWYGVDTDREGRVTRLDLHENRLIGRIPPELGSLSKLERLDLSDNGLSGWWIPPELGSLSNLERLDLNNNQIGGPIPRELGNLSNLESLDLGDNGLTGQIPPELGSLSNLERLDLNNNQLRGPIPRELGNLSNLESLDLGDNRLALWVPRELGNLSNLESLDLGDNSLRGSIPRELGNLSNLESLDLGGNSLSGEIPSELGKLSNLKELWLHGNQLSGCVPKALLNIWNNDFHSLGLPFCDDAAKSDACQVGMKLRKGGYCTITIPRISVGTDRFEIRDNNTGCYGHLCFSRSVDLNGFRASQSGSTWTIDDLPD